MTACLTACPRFARRDALLANYNIVVNAGKKKSKKDIRENRLMSSHSEAT